MESSLQTKKQQMLY